MGFAVLLPDRIPNTIAFVEERERGQDVIHPPIQGVVRAGSSCEHDRVGSGREREVFRRSLVAVFLFGNPEPNDSVAT